MTTAPVPAWQTIRGLGGGGLPCPLCGSGTVVLNSRKSCGSVRRRRFCMACGLRVATWEIVGDDFDKIAARGVAAALRKLADEIDPVATDEESAMHPPASECAA